MGYEDFWFVDTRVQTTNLKRWFLWGISLFIFVTICTMICVKSMYYPIKNYEIQVEEVSITVEEAKGTSANGYIKGKITNSNNIETKGKYLKFTFYTKNNVDIGNEYVELGTIEPEETKTYEVKYRYPNVERFVVNITNNND